MSTNKQGLKGVSLPEQKDAIQQYANMHNLTISAWFEERQTAAKAGRKIFEEMLSLLRSGKAHGVIIHKIDRSTRNAFDWAAIDTLLDSGVDVRYAHGSLDLQTRGGRLVANIEAAVAADYIRNLREETKKGFYGRLKQGLYPRPAPVGYTNVGPGKPKGIDPLKGPLVRLAFELYATGRYSLATLCDELFRHGLRNTRGRRIACGRLSDILNNPFYIGVMQVKKANETYKGVHSPLITPALFKRVQDALAGRFHQTTIKHSFDFRQLIQCEECGYSLIGERQKGRVYYRCHTRDCPTTGIREDRIDDVLLSLLEPLNFSREEEEFYPVLLERLQRTEHEFAVDSVNDLRLRLASLGERIKAAIDLYLDRGLDKVTFESKRKELLMEQTDLQDRLRRLQSGDLYQELVKKLELAKTCANAYKIAQPDEKRELIKIVTSNRVLRGKTLMISLVFPFDEIAKRHETQCGAPQRDTSRTWEALTQRLLTRLLPDSEVRGLAGAA